MGPFAITVTVAEGSAGSATVSWAPPTQNTSGSSDTDLVGYYIYYGTSADALTQIVSVAGGTITTYVIGNLAPGTYYFSVSGYTSEGMITAPSEVTSATI